MLSYMSVVSAIRSITVLVSLGWKRKKCSSGTKQLRINCPKLGKTKLILLLILQPNQDVIKILHDFKPMR